MRLTSWFPCILLVFIIAGCSGKPNENKIMQTVKEKYEKCYERRFHGIQNFKKVNGFDKGNSYVVEISFDLLLNPEHISFSNPQYPKVSIKQELTYLKSDNGWVLKESPCY